MVTGATPEAIVLPLPQPTVHQAIAAVMVEIGHVEKKRHEGGVSYPYQKVAEILAKAQPSFARHGVIFSPHRVIQFDQRDRTTSKGGLSVQADLLIQWRIYGPAGDFLEAETWGHAFDTSDKAFNKAMTASQKYALKLVLSIPEDADDQDDERPELGEQASPPPPFTKTVAKKVAVREFRMRGLDEAGAKREASEMWTAFGMDALDLTEQLVVEKVGTWLGNTEPFQETSGEGPAEVDSPSTAQHHGGPVAAPSPDAGEAAQWQGSGSMDDNGVEP